MWNLVLLIPDIIYVCAASGKWISKWRIYVCTPFYLTTPADLFTNCCKEQSIEWKKRGIWFELAMKLGIAEIHQNWKWDCTWAHNFQLTVWLDSFRKWTDLEFFFRLFGVSFQWNWELCRFNKILSCDWKQVHTFTHIFHLSALPILHPTHWFGF